MEILYSFLIIGISIIIPLLGQYLYKRYKLVYIKKMSYDKNNIDERFEEIYSKINNESVKKVEKLRKRIKAKKIIKNIIFVSVFLISIIFNIKYEELTQTLPIESYYVYQSIRG